MRRLPSFVLPFLSLLGFSAASLPFRRSHISTVLRQSRSPVFHNHSREKPHLSSLLASPSRTSARTEKRESRCLRNHRLPENPARGERRLGFWGAIRDCSSIFFLLEIALGSVFFLERQGVFFLVIRSWDYTANILLHRLWSTTSSNALCRLVRMEPPMPSAWDPPLGTILTL